MENGQLTMDNNFTDYQLSTEAEFHTQILFLKFRTKSFFSIDLHVWPIDSCSLSTFN